MRVAIVHYWFVGMRGGEKVIEALCELFPQADIFTHVYRADAVSPVIRRHKVSTSFIDRLPAAHRLYKSYLPLMPMALENLDLRGYDLVISSESGPAKGIVPPADATHICYCHSPMRYIWNMFHDYRERSGFLTRMMMPPIAHYIRNWDAASASRVDHFVSNSKTVARRVQSYYRRDSDVIFPPVDTMAFRPVEASELEDYYLMVGELVRYKRPDLAVEAFNRTRKKLVIIGGGEMFAKVKAMAGPTVSVLGPQPFGALQHHYARCRALVFPGEEDFGIVPVEAMASGRPVIAYGRGGATETVIADRTGVFFQTQSVEAIIDAIERLEAMDIDPSAITAHAAGFGKEVFTEKMRAYVDRRVHEKSAQA
ncbi:glycosyl transferase [Labrys okinawensis]|uniref:Glycosyl transferase n=1 Tax=Labrys okinawensis TaxID=346911 RepID=A0A2S9Q4Z7_9HYPH|nr:glycosyltransferase [Labrys okinawensis]PRH84421.1 glycosyl transferase [Labrys okinawensis]